MGIFTKLQNFLILSNIIGTRHEAKYWLFFLFGELKIQLLIFLQKCLTPQKTYNDLNFQKIQWNTSEFFSRPDHWKIIVAWFPEGPYFEKNKRETLLRLLFSTIGKSCLHDFHKQTLETFLRSFLSNFRTESPNCRPPGGSEPPVHWWVGGGGGRATKSQPWPNCKGIVKVA